MIVTAQSYLKHLSHSPIQTLLHIFYYILFTLNLIWFADFPMLELMMGNHIKPTNTLSEHNEGPVVFRHFSAEHYIFRAATRSFCYKSDEVKYPLVAM